MQHFIYKSINFGNNTANNSLWTPGGARRAREGPEGPVSFFLTFFRFRMRFPVWIVLSLPLGNERTIQTKFSRKIAKNGEKIKNLAGTAVKRIEILLKNGPGGSINFLK